MIELLQTTLFGSWSSVFRVIVSAMVMYPVIILCIRVSGKRSTSQMNGFDWIVTVALGSITGAAILQKSVPVMEAVVASVALLGMQWLLTNGTRYSELIEKLVKSEPRILFSDGRYLRDSLRVERIHEKEVTAAVRTAGFSSMSDVRWVILETDAKLSIIPRSQANGGDDSAVHEVNGYLSR